MKKILALLLALICTPLAAQNYLRDDGTFHSVVEGTTTGQLLGNSANLLSGVTVGSGLALTGGTLSTTAGGTGLVVGTTTIGSGTSLGALYNNAGVLGNTNSLANGVFITDTTGIPQASATLPTAVGREKLSANRTYYVRATGGSDTNCSGLTNVVDPGSGTLPRACAFQTPQKANDVTMYTLDLGGKSVTWDLTGTFTSGIACAGTFVGSGANTVLGAGTVVIASTAGASITTTSANAISASAGCALTITGANLTLSTITEGVALLAYDGGSITFGAVTFGAAATGHIQPGWVATPSFGLVAGPGNIYIAGSYTVTGSAPFHWHVTTDGSSLVSIASGITATLTGTPAFASFTAGITKGLIYVPGVTFSGGATGPQCLVHNGGALIGLVETAIPGNANTCQVTAGAVFNSLVGGDGTSFVGVNNIRGTVQAAPATPAAGFVYSWFDSTTFKLRAIDPAGILSTTVVADTGASNNFLTAISAAGVISKAQPAFTNISGTVLSAQLNADVFSTAHSWGGQQTFTAPILGTPASGTVTNLTGTASININGTVGATTPAAGVFTSLATSVPVTYTGTSVTIGATDTNVIFNPSGGFTVTMPSAATFPGRILNFKVIAAQTVSSAASNIVPVGSATPGTAIFGGASGKWGVFVSDASNWVEMSSN